MHDQVSNDACTLPIIYNNTLKFWAVHREFSDGIHGFFFPDVHDAIAAGPTFEEAKANAIMKLSSELQAMKELGLPFPIPSKEDHILNEGLKFVNDQSEEYPIKSWDVWCLQMDLNNIPQLTDDQHASIYNAVREIENEIRANGVTT